MFSHELCEISKNSFWIEHLPMTASVVSKGSTKFSESSFQKKKKKKETATAFKLDNLVKLMVSAIHDYRRGIPFWAQKE